MGESGRGEWSGERREGAMHLHTHTSSRRSCVRSSCGGSELRAYPVEGCVAALSVEDGCVYGDYAVAVAVDRRPPNRIARSASK